MDMDHHTILHCELLIVQVVIKIMEGVEHGEGNYTTHPCFSGSGELDYTYENIC